MPSKCQLRGVQAFLERGRKAEVLRVGDSRIDFDLHSQIARCGWIDWTAPSAVTVEIGLGVATEEQCEFIAVLAYSPFACIGRYPQKRGRFILTWESVPQQLPESAVGIKQVLTPVFDRALQQLPNIMVALNGPVLVPSEGVDEWDMTALLANPQGNS